MIFQHTHEAVLAGAKTQTRRRIGKQTYKVGGVYAVQPARGKKAVGYIRIKRVWVELPTDISDKDARAEGFDSIEAFLFAYTLINGLGSTAKPCRVIEFELVGKDDK